MYLQVTLVYRAAVVTLCAGNLLGCAGNLIGCAGNLMECAGNLMDVLGISWMCDNFSLGLHKQYYYARMYLQVTFVFTELQWLHCVLGISWDMLGISWDVLGISWDVLGISRDVLGI